MDLELFISSGVAVITIALYVVALWIGGQHTISNLASVSNLILALLVVVVGLAYSLGLQLSLMTNPGTWARAIGSLMQQI
jgi:hypothetical protein